MIEIIALLTFFIPKRRVKRDSKELLAELNFHPELSSSKKLWREAKLSQAT